MDGAGGVEPGADLGVVPVDRALPLLDRRGARGVRRVAAGLRALGQAATVATLGAAGGVIATGCPFCLTMFEDGLKDTRASQTRVRDLAEIVAERLGG